MILVAIISIILLVQTSNLFTVIQVKQIDTSSKFLTIIFTHLFLFLVFDKLKSRDLSGSHKNIRALYDMAIDKAPSKVSAMSQQETLTMYSLFK